jgi:hypothetical protein
MRSFLSNCITTPVVFKAVRHSRRVKLWNRQAAIITDLTTLTLRHRGRCLPARMSTEKVLKALGRYTEESRGSDRQTATKLGVNRITLSAPAANGLMSEHAFFEYKANPMSTPRIEEKGEPIHCLIKMEIGAGSRRPRELLKQEARDLIVFSVSPGPHRRISHSNICEVGEKRLRELGPATDFNRVGSVEIYFYSS